MKSHLFLFLFTLVSLAFCKIDIPEGWYYCGDSNNDLFKIESISMTPNPPKRGSKLTVRVTGYLDEDIDGGEVGYQVYLGKVPLIRDTIPLCKALQEEPGLPQCPLEKGKWDVEHTVDIPYAIPFGNFHVNAKGWDSKKNQIFCIEGSAQMRMMENDTYDQIDFEML